MEYERLDLHFDDGDRSRDTWVGHEVEWIVDNKAL